MDNRLPWNDDQHHLKVCIASMAPFIGGAEVAAERLALGLQDAGHEVFLLLGKQEAVMERMQRAGAECYILKTAPAEDLLAAIRGQQSAHAQ